MLQRAQAAQRWAATFNGAPLQCESEKHLQPVQKDSSVLPAHTRRPHSTIPRVFPATCLHSHSG